jgi:O6-methylguanine-DNA--protein-cysteine methyltransferase
MPRTDEAEAFFHAVYSAIQEIPYGKVTSYGHVAKLVGTRVWFFFTLPSFTPNPRNGI